MAKYCPVKLDQVLYTDCEECKDRRKCKVSKMPRSATGRCERCGKFVDPLWNNHIYLMTKGGLDSNKGFGYVQKGDKYYYGTPSPYEHNPQEQIKQKTWGFRDIFLCDDCKHELTNFLIDPRVQQYPEIKIGKGPYNQIIVSLDQSYTSTGVCVVCDGKIKYVTSWSVGAKHKDKNTRAIIYRRMFRYWLDNLLCALESRLCRDYKYDRQLDEEALKNIWNGTPIEYYGTPIEPRIIVCFERIRTFSQGHLSANYLIKTGALVGVILDVCSHHSGINCYSVDTRAWKKSFCGTSKPSETPNKFKVPDEKWPTVKRCLQLGLKDKIVKYHDTMPRAKKYIFTSKDGRPAEIDHDACDAVGIAWCAMHNPEKFINESFDGGLDL